MTKSVNFTSEMIKIFFKTLKIYLVNFPKFFRYLFFPIFGTLVGFCGILGVTFAFNKHLLSLSANYNLLLMLLLLLVLVAPFFLLLGKAIWDYIVAMVALCKAGCDLVATDELVNELKSYNSIVEYRELQYFLLIGILSVAYSVLAIPVFVILGVLFFLYTSLSLQAFAQDDRLSAFGALKRSFLVLPGHVPQTCVLLLLMGGLTYIVLPSLFVFVCNISHITEFLSKPIIILLNNIHLEQSIDMVVTLLQQTLNISTTLDASLIVHNCAVTFITLIISTLVVMYTLPLRAIACTLWYVALNK